MSGARGGFGRRLALGIGLAAALLLLAAGEARAGKYQVAQCGWYVGADANWWDATGGAKFRPDAWCVPPAGQDPFNGVHLKSFVREGQGTVTGTRFARWRWDAPAGTGIAQVSGTWWHALHDNMEHRLGVATWGGGFDVFARATSTDVTLRPFVAGFNPPQPAFEDRLLCARVESRWCSLSPQSWAGVRALTITVQDDHGPGAGIGGDVLAGGWRRGAQGVSFWGGDTGGGIRFGETLVDGGRVNLTEYPCDKAFIGGEWRGTRMRPCLTGVSGGASIGTGGLSDGPHSVGHCVTDFAGNVGCTPNHTFLVDNNPPAHPRRLTLAGGEEWRRVNDFDFSWANPDQGPASPIGGAFWRITGPAGADTGVHWAGGRNLAAIADRAVNGPGLYTFHVWLRDEAGNDAPATAVDVPLRFDNVPPGVAFDVGGPESGTELPQTVSASVTDVHSHPDGGTIHYRRLESGQWIELPTRFQAGDRADEGRLTAPLPESLGPGVYLFRADAVDGAGNAASSNRRADGTEMALRKTPPPPAVRGGGSARGGRGADRAGAGGRTKTRIFARLRRGRRAGSDLTVPFGSPVALSGRLLDADGAGLAGRELRVVARPSRGALAKRRVMTVRTGKRGGFRLDIGPGPSRRITVNYPGDGSHEPASRPSMTLRVRGGLTLRASPRGLSTGQALRLRGRVRTGAAPIPRRGKLVAIQYREEATGRWRPVLVTRSGHNGVFRARYRFRYVTGTAKIRLRAVALAEERWPYAPGTSRPVTVRVTG